MDEKGKHAGKKQKIDRTEDRVAEYCECIKEEKPEVISFVDQIADQLVPFLLFCQPHLFDGLLI